MAIGLIAGATVSVDCRTKLPPKGTKLSFHLHFWPSRSTFRRPVDCLSAPTQFGAGRAIGLAAAMTTI